MANTIIIFTLYMITIVSVNLSSSIITHLGFFECYVLKLVFEITLILSYLIWPACTGFLKLLLSRSWYLCIYMCLHVYLPPRLLVTSAHMIS